MQTQPTNLAIIIVNWNVRDLLANCLSAVQADVANSRLSSEIWVVDNGSTDGSVEMLRQDFPQVKLIASPKNLGFAAGNNAALRAMGFTSPSSPKENWNLPEVVLLLNPDTEVHLGALPTLYDFLKNNDRAGIVGANLLYGDGTFQHGAFDFPGLCQLAIDLLPLLGRWVESRLNGRYPRSWYESGQPFRIGHPLGAAMAVRREAIQQAGLLDEHYYMYVEEVDWSKRLALVGWQAYCVPSAKVTHFGGQSTDQVKINSLINLWNSRYRFYRTYYHPLKVKLAAWIVQVGLARKWAADFQAVKQGQLTEHERVARGQAYQKIITIWQGKSYE